MPPYLSLPNIKYKKSYLEALKEFQQESRQHYMQFDYQELENDFSKYVEDLKSRSLGNNLPEGYVPASEFWLIDDDEYIGRVDVRHELTDSLRKKNCHIGYDVRPSKRRMGYGTKILKLGLQKAKELGLENILITCDIGNTPSKKIIEKNGGVYEGMTEKEVVEPKLRFWIKV